MSNIKLYNETDTLPDGRIVALRAIDCADKAALQLIMANLSPESIYCRFLTYKRGLSEDELTQFTDADFINHVGLLASLNQNGKDLPVGVGHYFVSHSHQGARRAELAFAVEDAFQGFGIGMLLLKHLVLIARTKKIAELIAFVLRENTKMLNVFRHSGLEMHQFTSDRGLIEVILNLGECKPDNCQMTANKQPEAMAL